VTWALLALVAGGSFYVGRINGLSEKRSDSQNLSAAESNIERRPVASVSGDLAKQVEEIATLEKGRESDFRWEEFLDTMTSGQTEEVLFELQGLAPGPRKRNLLSLFFKRWGQLEGENALDAAQSLKGRDRLTFMSQALAGWARIDGAKAWEVAMKATNRGAKTSISLNPLLGEIAKSDVRLATEYYLELHKGRFHERTFKPIMDEAANTGNYAELLSFAAGDAQMENRDRFVEEIFERWGTFEFEAPLSALASLDDTTLVDRSMLGFMKGWASVDGEAALAYALENSADPMIENAIGPVAQILARSSTATEIVSLFEAIDDSAQKTKVLNSVVQEVAAADPLAAVGWAREMTDESLRSSSYAKILQTWARSDLESAKEFYFSGEMDSKTKSRSLMGFIFAGRDKNSPDEIVRMVEALDPGEDRKKSLSQAVSFSNGFLRSKENRDQLNDSLKTRIEESPIFSVEEKAAVREIFDKRKKRE